MGVTVNTNVVAKRYFQSLLDTDADAVCYMLLLPDVAQICALLAAGKNVVTTAGLIWPGWRDPATHAAIAEACAKGGSSFYVTGINPGWRSEEHTSELQSLMRSSYAVFCLKKK